MTDARFPERWLNDARLQRVSPSAYRLFGNGLMWTVANRTDGHLPAWSLSLIPHAAEADAKELASVSLWLDHPSDGWLVAGFEDTQTSRAELERKAADRKTESASRKRRRHHGDGDHSFCSADNCGMSGRTSGRTSGGRAGRSPLGQARHYVPASPEPQSQDQSQGQDPPSPFPNPGNGNGPEPPLPPDERSLMNGVQHQTSATAPIARASDGQP